MKYLIIDSDGGEASSVVATDNALKISNAYSEKTHHTRLIDSGGTICIESKVNGKVKSMGVPLHTLMDIENLLRCWRDGTSNLGGPDRIFRVGKEIK